MPFDDCRDDRRLICASHLEPEEFMAFGNYVYCYWSRKHRHIENQYAAHLFIIFLRGRKSSLTQFCRLARLFHLPYDRAFAYICPSPVLEIGKEQPYRLSFTIIDPFTTANMWMQTVAVSLALLSGARAAAIDAPFSNYQSKISA